MIWGGAFPAIKYLLDFMTPLQLVKFRYSLAIPFFPIVLLSRRQKGTSDIFRKYWGKLIIAAFFGVIGYNLALAYGEMRIPAGIASLIINLSPIFTLIFSILFLKETPTLNKAAGMIISMLGLFILVGMSVGTSDKMEFYIYALITILAPLSWAIYTVASKPLAERFDSWTATGVPMIIGTLPLLLCYTTKDWEVLRGMNLKAWGSLLFLSYLSTCAGYSGWVWALRQMTSSKVASFVYLIPVSSVAMSWFFLGEKITLHIIIGACLLLSGVYVVNRKTAGSS